MNTSLSETKNDPTADMSRRCFGYGRWEAPYWFIGPEQAQAREENDDLKYRLRAWLQLGAGELCDCRDFPSLIGEESWHRGKPRLQPTWRPWMLLLSALLYDSFFDRHPTQLITTASARNAEGIWYPLVAKITGARELWAWAQVGCFAKQKRLDEVLHPRRHSQIASPSSNRC